MGLAAVFEQLAEDLGPEVRVLGPDDNPDDEERPGRVTWDPIAADQADARRTGGGPNDDGDILTRVWAVKVEVWGDDFDATEELADTILAKLHDITTRFNYDPGKETWNTGGVTGHGCVCTMVLTLKVPIKRTALKVVRPTPVTTWRMGNTEQTE